MNKRFNSAEIHYIGISWYSVYFVYSILKWHWVYIL